MAKEFIVDTDTLERMAATEMVVRVWLLGWIFVSRFGVLLVMEPRSGC